MVLQVAHSQVDLRDHPQVREHASTYESAGLDINNASNTHCFSVDEMVAGCAYISSPSEYAVGSSSGLYSPIKSSSKFEPLSCGPPSESSLSKSTGWFRNP